jgi:flagellar protein FliO/FliZ
MRPYLLTIWALLISPASAAPAADNGSPLPGQAAPDLFGAGLKMFSSLIFIIVALLLVLYFLRRLNARKPGGFGSGPIKVLATKSLAPRKYIALVQVADKVLTLGVTQDRITCLHTLEADQFQKQTAASSETDNAAPEGTFAQKLAALGGRRRPNQEDKS